MGKREPQTIVKTDERDIASSSGVMGNLPLNQAVGAKTEFSSRATSSRSQSRRSLVAHAPARRLDRKGCHVDCKGIGELRGPTVAKI